MENFQGGKDEQFAAGAIVGGSASLIGPTAVGVVKTFAIKYLGSLGAVKLGITASIFNPVIGGIALVGGVSYLIYKAAKE